jgi:hypothetical protein
MTDRPHRDDDDGAPTPPEAPLAPWRPRGEVVGIWDRTASAAQIAAAFRAAAARERRLREGAPPGDEDAQDPGGGPSSRL